VTPTTIVALVRARAASHGPREVIVDDETSMSYDELDTRSRRVARSLLAAGVDKGTRVGLLMSNGIEWVVDAVAVMRIGAVLVPLSTLLRPPELEAQLRIADAGVLIAQPECRGRHHLVELEAHIPGVTSVGGDGVRHQRLPELRHVWSSESLPVDLAGESILDAIEEQVRPEDDMAVMFTSGSRGAPKGVIHTHGGALRATARGLDARCIGDGDRLYIPMPFFWMGGFGGGLISVMLAGATLLSEANPTPASTIRFLERERATLFRGWPDQAVRIAAAPEFATADLSSLRPGSLDAVLPAALRAEPGARANLFGMTETFGPYAGFRLDTDLEPAHRGSCGLPFEGVEVRIVDVETAGPLPPGAQGVIEVGGPDLMRGICGRSREETFTADGYYSTGDLGSLDADGYLFFTGRADDMFKVSGATVFPTEVEASLRSIDFVSRADVTSIEGPDGAAVVGALVVVGGDHDVDELDRESRRLMSSFKVPRRWIIATSVDSVPMLPTGKVDQAALRALLASDGRSAPRERRAGQPPSPSNTELTSG
jgi:acyl-CoA synthetase (AMP-forming)/AMP-acid ligase II